MKRLFLNLTAVSIIFVACEKDEHLPLVIEANQGPSEESVNLPDESRPDENTFGDRAATKRWYDNGGTDFGCSTHQFPNCADVVVVTTTPDQVAISDVFDAVDSGVWLDIEDAFTDHYTLLTADIPSIFVDGVLSQAYEARISGEFSSGNTGYLKFIRMGAVSYVQPYNQP